MLSSSDKNSGQNIRIKSILFWKHYTTDFFEGRMSRTVRVIKDLGIMINTNKK